MSSDELLLAELRLEVRRQLGDRRVLELLDLADELRRLAEEHRAEYPGAYADGLEAAADLIRTRARDLP